MIEKSVRKPLGSKPCRNANCKDEVARPLREQGEKVATKDIAVIEAANE